MSICHIAHIVTLSPNNPTLDLYEVWAEAGVGGATGVVAFSGSACFADLPFLAGADLLAALAGMAPFLAAGLRVLPAAFFAVFLSFAQRAFWAAAIFERASALKVRFGVLFPRKLAPVGFFEADATAGLRAVFFATLLDFAQRAFWAAEILARAPALKVRRGLVLPTLAPAGFCGFAFHVLLVPAKSDRACRSRAISASISKTMWFVSMNPPPLRITQCVNSLFSRVAGEVVSTVPQT